MDDNDIFSRDSIKSAVLVGVQLPKISNDEFESSLQELQRLVKTLGYNVVGRVIQRRSSNKTFNVLGDGKLMELAQWTGGTGRVSSLVNHKKSKAALKWEAEGPDGELDADEIPNIISEEQIGSAQVVVVDSELSPSQLRNLESVADVRVLDRTGVIIQIFSRHARTRAARMQVEIARLAYIAPRLRETGGNEDRGGGKGAGETSLELDKRRIRDRIKMLKTDLESIGNEHQQRRTRRGSELCIALVGYTNAGKSSLMRAMTGSEVLVADKLFATLDTTIRPLHPETRPKILVSDTVGFIKQLPHDLVASFKSTLDEALFASLLLFVVDASDASFRSQLEVTQSVLSEVGATDAPRLLILNKQDLLSPEQITELTQEFPDAIMISTRDASHVQALREKILSYFEKDMIEEELFISYTAKGIIGMVREKVRVLAEKYDENGVSLKVRATEDTLNQIKKKILSTNTGRESENR